jgi:hypothetical protein
MNRAAAGRISLNIPVPALVLLKEAKPISRPGWQNRAKGADK